MKQLGSLLIACFLFNPAWAVAKSPVIPVPEVQQPFSFLPPTISIFSNKIEIKSTKNIQRLPELPILEPIHNPEPLPANFHPHPSWVRGISPQQGQLLATMIAKYVATQRPVATTTVQLISPKSKQARWIQASLEDVFRQAGFALASSKTSMPGAVRVSYQINRVDQEIILQLFINQSQATRIYTVMPNHTFAACTPFTILEGGLH